MDTIFFGDLDRRTGSALGLIACHADSSWPDDLICYSLLLVNNIPGAKYVNLMIMHIPPDHFLPHTFLATAVKATQTRLCEEKTRVFNGTNGLY